MFEIYYYEALSISFNKNWLIIENYMDQKMKAVAASLDEIFSWCWGSFGH